MKLALSPVALFALTAGSAVHAAAPDRIFEDGIEACSMMIDADMDRLYDCEEVLQHRTDPLAVDTDADGLPDGDEVLGTLGGLDLPAFGVTPRRKDVLVEYDWFDDANGCSAHSHRLTQTQANEVATAFASMPVANPDGTTGIRVIQDFGQGGLFTGGEQVPSGDGFLAGNTQGPAFAAIKAAHFATARRGYFHYGLLAHRFNTPTYESTGNADRFDDFIVTFACRVTWADRSHKIRNTVIHELGHNFGLLHGGPNDRCNWKPNYNSVMNYRYQLDGIDLACVGDPAPYPLSTEISRAGYSVGVRADLDETSLDEASGVCAHMGPTSPAVDWNGNGVIDAKPVVFDLDKTFASPEIQQENCGGAGIYAVLEDHDDYASIDLARVATPDDDQNGIFDKVGEDCAPLTDDAP